MKTGAVQTERRPPPRLCSAASARRGVLRALKGFVDATLPLNRSLMH